MMMPQEREFWERAACEAMAGMLSRVGFHEDWIASMAGQYADAMLKEWHKRFMQKAEE